MKKILILLISLFPLFCCAEGNNQYFNQKYIDKIIENKVKKNENIIFNESKEKSLGLDIYDSKVLNINSSENRLYQYYINYKNYNIILLTENIDKIEYVRDYVIIKKQNSETYLANGPVEINEEYFDWDITVVVNSKLKTEFTTDISEAFIVDLERKKIESFKFNIIKLYSEV